MAERETKFSVTSDYTPAAANTTYTETLISNGDSSSFPVIRYADVDPGANAWIDLGFYNGATFVRMKRVEQGVFWGRNMGDGMVGPQGYDVAYQIRSSDNVDLGKVSVNGAFRRRTT